MQDFLAIFAEATLRQHADLRVAAGAQAQGGEARVRGQKVAHAARPQKIVRHIAEQRAHAHASLPVAPRGNLPEGQRTTGRKQVVCIGVSIHRAWIGVRREQEHFFSRVQRVRVDGSGEHECFQRGQALLRPGVERNIDQFAGGAQFFPAAQVGFAPGAVLAQVLKIPVPAMEQVVRGARDFQAERGLLRAVHARHKGKGGNVLRVRGGVKRFRRRAIEKGIVPARALRAQCEGIGEV